MWNPLRRRKNSLNRSFTSVLFDPPSFLAGMARSIDMGNTLTDYNKSMTPEQADHNALAADWLAVGRDFRIALDTVVASDQRLAIFDEGELAKEGNLQKMQIGPGTKPTTLYSVDVAISVGYRVNSAKATKFRQWSTSVLRSYVERGFVLDPERMASDPEAVQSLERTIRQMRWTSGCLGQAVSGRTIWLRRLAASWDRGLLYFSQRTGEPLVAAAIRDVRHGSLGRTQPLPVTPPTPYQRLWSGVCAPRHGRTPDNATTPGITSRRCSFAWRGVKDSLTTALGFPRPVVGE